MKKGVAHLWLIDLALRVKLGERDEGAQVARGGDGGTTRGKLNERANKGARKERSETCEEKEKQINQKDALTTREHMICLT